MKQFSKLFLSLVLLFAVSTVLADNAVKADATSGSKSISSPDSVKAPKVTTKIDAAALKGLKSFKSTDDESTNDNDKLDCPNFTNVHSILLPRPAYFSPALVDFMNPFLYGCDSNLCDTCFTFGIGYRFHSIRKSDRLARGLFGTDTISITGSLVNNRPPTGSIIADYLGLDPLYEGSISFKPKIKQHNIDFAMRWELGSWAECLDCAWFGVEATLVHSKWSLNPTIGTETLGTIQELDCRNALPTGLNGTKYPGYMNIPTETATPGAFLVPPPSTGYTPATSLAQVLGTDFTFGDMRTPLEFGRFDLNRKHKGQTKLANVSLFLGYDFARCADYHFGLFFLAIAPTGTKLDREFAQNRFHPVIGNAHHWEIGGGLNAHWDVWRCDNQCFGIYLNGIITTSLKNRQWRTFGINGMGPLSEFVLLKEFDAEGNLIGLTNAASFTTREIQSSFKVQGEATLRLQYQNCGWLAAIGYDIYGRSKEKLCKANEFKNAIDDRHFGLKGITGMAYWNPTAGKWLPLATTQTNFSDIDSIFDTNGPIIPRSDYNPAAEVPCNTQNIDNPTNVAPLATEGSVLTWDGLPFVHNTAEPVLITRDDINFEGGRIRKLIQHTVFGELGYQWSECDWKPYFTVGGEYNFTKKCDFQPTTWGIWLQGGISF